MNHNNNNTENQTLNICFELIIFVQVVTVNKHLMSTHYQLHYNVDTEAGYHQKLYTDNNFVYTYFMTIIGRAKIT